MQSSSHLYTEPDSPQLIPSSFSSESPPDSLAWNNKPIPVPNLTKKARGRAVPTKDALLKPGNTGRHFMCTVEDCRKVFTRSEHLKRHTRSIHTNERPFQCDEPDCGKFFTRHDNLLQHQRSHRNSASSRSRNNSLSDTSGPLERIYTSLEPLDPTSSVGSMGILLPSPVTSSPMSYTSVSPLSPHPRQHSLVVDRTSTPASPASPRDFRSTMESGRGFATNHSLGRLDTQQAYYVPAERSPTTSRSEAQRFGRSDSEDSMMQQVHISTPLRDLTFFTDR
ncbi:hypothetical protein C8Q75DRAFT_718362 [Abortiporus biennis]|nr:hypothetical protein C8Q75DRAFT_718362 [Abortiporus biennis]